MDDKYDDMLANVEEARHELQSGRTWAGMKHANEAITIAEELFDNQEVSLASFLDLRSQMADTYLQAGLVDQAAEEDEFIEGSLSLIEDEDEREGLELQIQQRKDSILAPQYEDDEFEGDLGSRCHSHEQHKISNESLTAPSSSTSHNSMKSHRRSETVEALLKKICIAEDAPQTLPPKKSEDLALQLPDESAHFGPSLRSNVLHNLITPEGRSDVYFEFLADRTHKFLRGENNRFQETKYSKVRIAILDTGFSKNDSATRSFSHKVEKCLNFFTESAQGVVDKTDEVGHGTNVAYQLSRVCPNAVLHSYRIAKGDKDGHVKADREAVIRALRAAIGKVDIINMSFGWEHVDPDVSDGLHDAQKNGILLFASVSNFGALGITDVLFPASSAYVIAVDAADGLGNPASFNSAAEAPESPNIDRFSAPGEKVLGVGGDRVSGSSFASPIVAGIAALVLEFARQKPLGRDEMVSSCLKTRVGMASILRLMHKRKNAERFLFLRPWALLDDPKGKYGGDGESKSKRFDVARRIIEELRKVYGYDRNIGDAVLED